MPARHCAAVASLPPFIAPALRAIDATPPLMFTLLLPAFDVVAATCIRQRLSFAMLAAAIIFRCCFAAFTCLCRDFEPRLLYIRR